MQPRLISQSRWLVGEATGTMEELVSESLQFLSLALDPFWVRLLMDSTFENFLTISYQEHYFQYILQGPNA